jgi:(4S)-4-hydroxy-5-phosphonooxypentane-2,3-dione isomerase
MYIVTVLFKIKPAHYREFIAAMASNARTSVAAESGCHQFDVCEGGDAQNHMVFLYEVYGSPADFQAHLATPHFLEFNALTAPWVQDKKVSTFARLE